jgi:deoxyribodipyrimidine photo-lyase
VPGLFGLHDRPWGERAIYGTVRSMAASGLERKFDVDAYVASVLD